MGHMIFFINNIHVCVNKILIKMKLEFSFENETNRFVPQFLLVSH